MKLSKPIYLLKREAKLMARKDQIPLHQALNQIAAEEGYSAWSWLVSRHTRNVVEKIYSELAPGHLVLLGARPHQGKTRLSLQLLVKAMQSGYRGVFFTLDYTEKDIESLFRSIGTERTQFDGQFEFDDSDLISANYIIEKLSSTPSKTLVVIDYLQLLDQKRDTPELMQQVQTLRSFAQDRGLVFIFISQINRSYDPSKKPFPDTRDVRLPNPLNLKLFDKKYFLSQGEVQIRSRKIRSASLG